MQGNVLAPLPAENLGLRPGKYEAVPNSTKPYELVTCSMLLSRTPRPAVQIGLPKVPPEQERRELAVVRGKGGMNRRGKGGDSAQREIVARENVVHSG